MSRQDRSDRYCIIGAGAAGITAAKNLREQGIPFDIVEREDDIGGTWYYGKPCSAVYRSVHMISYNIDADTHTRLGVRNDGLVVDHSKR